MCMVLLLGSSIKIATPIWSENNLSFPVEELNENEAAKKNIFQKRMSIICLPMKDVHVVSILMKNKA